MDALLADCAAEIEISLVTGDDEVLPTGIAAGVLELHAAHGTADVLFKYLDPNVIAGNDGGAGKGPSPKQLAEPTAADENVTGGADGGEHLFYGLLEDELLIMAAIVNVQAVAILVGQRLHDHDGILVDRADVLQSLEKIAAKGADRGGGRYVIDEKREEMQDEQDRENDGGDGESQQEQNCHNSQRHDLTRVKEQVDDQSLDEEGG